jgi:hypothetical protein
MTHAASLGTHLLIHRLLVVVSSQVWFYREGFARFTKNRYSSAKVRLALRNSPLVFAESR